MALARRHKSCARPVARRRPTADGSPPAALVASPRSRSPPAAIAPAARRAAFSGARAPPRRSPAPPPTSPAITPMTSQPVRRQGDRPGRGPVRRRNLQVVRRLALHAGLRGRRSPSQATSSRSPRRQPAARLQTAARRTGDVLTAGEGKRRTPGTSRRAGAGGVAARSSLQWPCGRGAARRSRAQPPRRHRRIAEAGDVGRARRACARVRSSSAAGARASAARAS